MPEVAAWERKHDEYFGDHLCLVEGSVCVVLFIDVAEWCSWVDVYGRPIGGTKLSLSRVIELAPALADDAFEIHRAALADRANEIREKLRTASDALAAGCYREANEMLDCIHAWGPDDLSDELQEALA